MAFVSKKVLEFLQSSKLADFTVKCNGFEWKVHQVILASGSVFFEKACGGSLQEAAEKVIILREDEPEMVARMLLFLYTSDYPTLSSKSASSRSPTLKDFLLQGGAASGVEQFQYETNPLLVHSKMYALAEKYDIPGLQAKCVTKFIISGPPTQLQRENLLDALPHVYTSTPPSRTALRQKAVAFVPRSYNAIMSQSKLKAQLESACLQSAQLGWDILSEMVGYARFHLPVYYSDHNESP